MFGAASPAFADDQSEAVAACRASVARQVEGLAPNALDLDRIGGGGRRFKVWLAASPAGADSPRQFYCLVKRDGTVEELTALNADGSPGQSLLAAR
ncbi:hypothetical protein [Pedomonas mirosovicensis]|uniref:hypothetical protein n=1 Tax=Pedomonas mirosovicensis TaxID=2908641 RepID=UPI0021696032|nr:hypothetical protein [Pedomonas mirosovicensis]MCH8683788.1 hypothetical protein [Pedomonas mirosovicensis]